MKKICVVCGKEFEVGNHKSTVNTCSEECRKIRQREKQMEYRNRRAKKKSEEPRACTFCGAEFKPENREKVCPECRKAITTDTKIILPEELKPKHEIIPLDERLKDAKKHGFEPWQYGKYKTMKTLEKIPKVNVNV